VTPCEPGVVSLYEIDKAVIKIAGNLSEVNSNPFRLIVTKVDHRTIRTAPGGTHISGLFTYFIGQGNPVQAEFQHMRRSQKLKTVVTITIKKH